MLNRAPADADDDNAALIGGIVGGVVALLLIGGLIAFLVVRSRRSVNNAAVNTYKPATDVLYDDVSAVRRQH